MSKRTADERAHTMFDEDFDFDTDEYTIFDPEDEAAARTADVIDAYTDRRLASQQGLRYRDW